jgi:hypothetical protein
MTIPTYIAVGSQADADSVVYEDESTTPVVALSFALVPADEPDNDPITITIVLGPEDVNTVIDSLVVAHDNLEAPLV